MRQPRSTDSAEVRRAVPVIVSGRLLGNLYSRFPYVLLNALARGLGIPVATATTVLGLRELGGLATPVVGHVVDRGHERTTMLTAAGATGVVCIAAGLSNSLPLFCVVMVIGGVSKIAGDTAQTAWLGHRVPFARRGRVYGITELSWSLAFLLGVPVCTWLTGRYGWRAPFVAVGGAILVATAATALFVGPDEPRADGIDSPSVRDLLRWRPPAGSRAIFGYAFLQPFTQMMLFAVAGAWFGDALRMGYLALGRSTMLLGAGEFVGTLATVWAADRFGKRRSAIVGMALVVPPAAALGLVGHRAALGVALLVVVAIGIEFSWVAALPLFAELSPESRGAAIGSLLATCTVSRAIASVVAGLVYTRLGIGATGAAAATLAALTALSMWGVVEPDRSRVVAVVAP